MNRIGSSGGPRDSGAAHARATHMYTSPMRMSCTVTDAFPDATDRTNGPPAAIGFN